MFKEFEVQIRKCWLSKELGAIIIKFLPLTCDRSSEYYSDLLDAD